MGYGKIFETLFTGSMVGAGAPVFAVWSYVIACHRDGVIDLNPALLSTMIGEPAETIQRAIDYLCAEDPHSRTDGNSGRRLTKIGGLQYHVTNWLKYKRLMSKEERKEYQREWDRANRPTKPDKTRRTPTIPTQPEAEPEPKAEANTYTKRVFVKGDQLLTSKTQELRESINSLMRREPTDFWSYMEEQLLCEVARRPKCLEEFREISQLFGRSNRRFVSQTVTKLLADWSGNLDRARREPDREEVTGSDKVILGREYERILQKMMSMKSSYGDHQDWSDQDRCAFKKLLDRKNELKGVLGVQV